MEKVYKERWLIDFIVETVAKSKVTNQFLLEERIYSKLTRYFDKYPNAHRHRKKLRQIVFKEIFSAESAGGYRTEISVEFSAMQDNEDFGESLEYEPKDNRARVFDIVSDREDIKKVISLATDDRKRVALNGLMDGNTVTQVSETLARLFGGNSETHRKFITRFRSDCNSAVNAAV